MNKIVKRITEKLERIVDIMIPKSRRIIDENLLTKLSHKGLNITHCISSVLSNIFLINFIVGGLLNFYIYIRNASYGIMVFNWFAAFILDFLLPTLISLIPYILMRLITVFIGEKVKDTSDRKEVLFVTGFFLISTHIEGVIQIIISIFNLIIRMPWNSRLDLFVQIVVQVTYIYIGLKYINNSNFLHDKTSEKNI